MRVRKSEMVQQRQRVSGHGGWMVILGVVAFRRMAMSAVVDGDGTVPCFVQCRNPARRFPIDAGIGRKTMNEQHRIALSAIHVCKVKPVMGEMFHQKCPGGLLVRNGFDNRMPEFIAGRKAKPGRLARGNLQNKPDWFFSGDDRLGKRFAALDGDNASLFIGKQQI